MDYVDDPAELVRRLNRYAYREGVDAELAEKLQTIPGVAAEQITQGAEILYVHRDLLDEQGLRVMGELFNYAKHQGWAAFNREDRSKDIVNMVAIELGEKKGSVKPELMPEPETLRRGGLDWRKPE